MTFGIIIAGVGRNCWWVWCFGGGVTSHLFKRTLSWCSILL